METFLGILCNVIILGLLGCAFHVCMRVKDARRAERRNSTFETTALNALCAEAERCIEQRRQHGAKPTLWN